MYRIFRIGGHLFMISGEHLCNAVGRISGFRPFKTAEGDPLFSFNEEDEVPEMLAEQYAFSYENVTGTFGRTLTGYILSLSPSDGDALYMWHDDTSRKVLLAGNMSIRLLRFALWLGYGLATLPYNTVAIHSSCVVYQNQAVLFLGESGTGKSTHSRLWLEHIHGTELLNDDSPVIRIEDGDIWAYGSPWSGKTPCYKTERHILKACVRLSQAPFNSIERLSVLKAYAAIHPSCPPEFAYDTRTYEFVSGFISRLLTSVPIYQLRCLPNKDAALMSYKTIFTTDL